MKRQVLQFQYVPAQCDRDRFGPVVRSEFLVKFVQMLFDAAFRYAELGGDVVV